jgi:hypothetical protein
MIFLRIIIPLYYFVEHDLFRKPVPTFRDHALADQSGFGRYPPLARCLPLMTSPSSLVNGTNDSGRPL